MTQIVPIGGEIAAVGSEMPAAPGVVPVGGEITAIGGEMRAPDFRSSNDPAQATALLAKQREDDAAATKAAEPSWLELGANFAKGWASGVNPLPLLKAMYDNGSGHFKKALEAARSGEFRTLIGESGATLNAPGAAVIDGLIQAHWQQFQKAKKAYDAGRYSEAAGYTAAGVLPLVGPMAAQAGEQIGTGDPREMARGFGTAAAAVRPQAGAEAVGAVARGVGRVVSGAGRAVVGGVNLNPLEAASNDFARAEDVPLDAATATGSRWMRAAQKRTANSIGGEAGATDLINAQRDALGKVGDKLAGEANGAPGQAGAPVLAEGAAEGVRGSIHDLITTLHDEASKQYGEVRKAEAKPGNLDTVDLKPAPVDALKDWHLVQLRRIAHELDASGHEKPFLERGNPDLHVGGSGDTYHTAKAGAAVYHDILEKVAGDPTRADVQGAIEAYLGGGEETPIAKAALDVAKRRFMGDRNLSAAELPIDAGQIPTRLEKARQTSAEMPMAIDLRAAKKALTPIRDRMGAGGAIAPLMGAKATAYAALQRLINGPDFAPLSVVDEALGDLKAMARGGKNGPAVPELRSAGQGTAAYAVSQLEKLVRERAAKAGPDVLQALEEGRAATRGKAEVGDVLEQLREEPIGVFRQLTAPKDAGVQLLRKVRDVAPAKMPDVARAWLEQQMELARREGGFGHADKLWSDWQNLGTETKRILFSAPGQTQALDRFFLLAKRVAENPNPSGTAHNLTAFNVGSIPVTAGLAKLLYSKGGVDALTRWMASGLPRRGGAPAMGATKAAAWASLVVAAKRSGVELPAAVPMAADSGQNR